MISANGGLPAHRYTPQVTQRWPRGSEPASDGVLDDGRDGVMFLLALWRLRRYLFVYLGSKFSTSCFNAFRRALFSLCVFYAI